MENPNEKLLKLTTKNDGIVPCPNVKVCGNYKHQNMLDCCSGRCLNCDIFLGEWQGGKGNLDFKTIELCYICLEENIEGVSMPKCDHFICVECFKKCFDLTSEPFYPNEIQEEMFKLSKELPEDTDEDKLFEIIIERRPDLAEIVNIYLTACDKVHNTKHLTDEERERLSRCSLCRR